MCKTAPFTSQQKRLVYTGTEFILQDVGGPIGYAPKIHLQRDAIHVGCYTVERSVIEKILELFKEHYPANFPITVAIQ